MLEGQMWFDFCDALPIEVRQCVDEGLDAEGFLEEAAAIKNMEHTQERKERGLDFLERFHQSPVRSSYPFEEPERLDDIFSAADLGPACSRNEMAWEGAKADLLCGNKLYDKIYGAWLGRAAGCLLGQPVESWTKARICGLLSETGNYPVKNYMSSHIPEAMREKYGVYDEKKVYGGNKVNWINNVTCMPEDDDTNYTLLALKIIETYGREFTPENVAMCWLESLPILHVCTAERVAYINFVNGIAPPCSASFHNAYREYLGAAIRADLYGYIYPGEPEKAVALAYKDAVISHRKNGVYGAMFMAGMISAAFVVKDIRSAVEAGLSQVPKKSRLWAAIRQFLNGYDTGMDVEAFYQGLHAHYNENEGYDWCHIIPNMLIVCAGLLFGNGDMDKTLGTCLCAGFDTDCNGASAGSVLGAYLGAKQIPDKWTQPLADRIRSGVDGMGTVKISDAAERTARFARESLKSSIK